MGLDLGVELLKDSESVFIFLLGLVVSVIVADEVNEFSFSISDWGGGKERSLLGTVNIQYS